MRVLLAIDGSPHAAVAVDLVASLAWPDGTQIRLVCVQAEPGQFGGAPWIPAAPAELQRFEDDLLAVDRTALETATAAIARPGRSIDARVVRGRPATAIVAEAATFDADVVVLGSRGHGTFEAALLGSVSAEVVDLAPCPVLVARRGWVRKVLVADDGSPEAERARTAVRDWPILRGLPACVTSVATVPIPWEASTNPLAGAFAVERYEIALAERRRAHAEIALRAHDDLAVDGRPVEYSVPVGAPAAQVIDAATAYGADLIVLGSHGRTGLRRLVLGSVARSVLLHAPCSVLIVRRPAA